MSLITTVTNPSNLVSALAVVLLGGTAVTLVKPYLRGDSLEGRMKMVANRREELRRRSRAAIAKDGGLRQTDETLYKKIVDRLNLQKLLEDPKVLDNLAQAGLRGPKPVSTYYFFRFALPFIFAALAALYVFVISGGGMQFMQRILIIFGAFGAGFYAPTIYLKNAAGKRRQSIVRAFPDALDLLLICVESGMSIETAIQRVSQEIGGQSIELAEEMSLLVAELSYLPDRRMAYENLTRRVNDPGVKSVATAMTQAESYGTPLGAALRVMAKENRELRLTAAEKKAAALPAKLTVPMILFFLPVLFSVIMGPAIMRVLDSGVMHTGQQ
jgi:tight adherence protein C